MPGRSLAEINKELLAKQLELDELTADGQFRPTVDNIEADLSEVTDFLEKTSEGIGNVAEKIGDDVKELSGAVDGMKDLLEGDAVKGAIGEAIDKAGDTAGKVQGGLESSANVINKVNGGLEKIQKALELIQDIDDLGSANGAEQLEKFAEIFETVVEELGPLVDKVPGLGAFFRLYAAGIRNIANSAKIIQDRVNEFDSIYHKAGSGGHSPDSSLYMTAEWFADKHYRTVQADYDRLLDEAMDAAKAEREGRNAPPPDEGFDPIRHVVYAAVDRCDGLLPDANSDAARKRRAAEIALKAARLSWSVDFGAVETIKLTGKGDLVRAQANLAGKQARLDAAEARYAREGSPYDAEWDAYNDCVKGRIKEFSTLEGFSAGQITQIGFHYPQWDISEWEPTVSTPARTGHGLATAGVVIGGALFAVGLTLSASSGFAGAVGALFGAAPGPAASTATSSALDFSPWMPAINPLPATIDIADPEADDGSGLLFPTIVDYCVAIRHGSGSSTIVYSIRVAGAPPGASVVLTIADPSGGPDGFSTHAAVIDEHGDAQLEFPIFVYGSYEVISVDIDPGDSGEFTSASPSDIGGGVVVTAAEPSCDPADLAPLPPEPEPETDAAVSTVAATPGGGVVTPPSVDASRSEGTVVTPGTPGPAATLTSSGSNGDDGSAAAADSGSGAADRAMGLGLVAAATAGLATALGADRTGSRTRQRRQGPLTFSADDRAFLQEIYKGANEAGVNIVGISRVDSIEDAFAGKKDNPVKIGKSATLYVRVGADGSLLPPRGASDTAAASILKIDVRPGVEFDSEGNKHVVWNSHVTQIDTSTADITHTSSAGPTNAEWEAKVAGRTDVEIGNDPAFKDWVVESMPSTPGEAVKQALGGATVSP